MPALPAVLLTFSFQFSLLLINISFTRPHQSHIYGSAPHQHCSILFGQYRTVDVAENLAKYLSGAQHTAQKKDCELILTFKVETRHPIGGPFGREFLAFVIIPIQSLTVDAKLLYTVYLLYLLTFCSETSGRIKPTGTR